ncbi:hypothetical protein ACFFRR_004101 [Megaselia abdita]
MANPGQFPYQIGIHSYTSSGTGYLCGGSITSKNWILTAGHCVDGKVSATIIAGSININDYDENSQIRSASKGDFYLHPSYQSGSLKNDIAMIFVPDLIFTDFVQPVDLLYSNESYVGEETYIAGWGVTDVNNTLSDDLLYVELMVDEFKKCNRTYGSLREQKQICLKATDTMSPCPGDSGGPLVLAESEYGINYGQIGLVSFGSNCTNGDPVVFTRVSGYRTFIENTMISRYCSMGSCFGLPGRN